VSKKKLKSAMITDDSFDNFLQARGFSRGMVGYSEASTHPTRNPCYARFGV